jgi:hypothetical protein
MALAVLAGSLPDQIDRFRVDAVAGAGGMGVVLRATDTVLQRPVALKVLGAAGGLDVGAKARLIGEAKHLAKLQHPHVVSVYDAGESDGVVYIAMRWVEGPDLETVVAEEGPLAPDRAARIVGQVASALHAAHADGLVHRDVKPANVLLCAEDGHALLTDFGLTTGTDAGDGVTATGELIGTPDYAAPEQFDGRPVDHRADVYALGGLAYRLLAGEVPYPRDGTIAKLWAHANDAPPRLRDRVPDAPAALDAAIARAMAKDPADRFPSAAAFAAAVAAATGTRAPAPAGAAAMPAAGAGAGGATGDDTAEHRVVVRRRHVAHRGARWCRPSPPPCCSPAWRAPSPSPPADPTRRRAPMRLAPARSRPRSATGPPRRASGRRGAATAQLVTTAERQADAAGAATQDAGATPTPRERDERGPVTTVDAPSVKRGAGTAPAGAAPAEDEQPPAATTPAETAPAQTAPTETAPAQTEEQPPPAQTTAEQQPPPEEQPPPQEQPPPSTTTSTTPSPQGS